MQDEITRELTTGIKLNGHARRIYLLRVGKRAWGNRHGGIATDAQPTAQTNTTPRRRSDGHVRGVAWLDTLWAIRTIRDSTG